MKAVDEKVGRFIGNSKYELSEYKDRISNIEKSFSKLVPLTCEEGCYYDKFVKKPRIFWVSITKLQ